jgi:hypothetical protein
MLASLFLSGALGAPRWEGIHEVVLAAVAAALAPTFVMMAHLKTNGELRDEDQRLWRALLFWIGPVAGAVYLTLGDRRLSESPIAWILRNFLD